MPSRGLLIEVRLLTGRYHGTGDWPPAPFRLFQALVAGAYGGRWADEDAADKDVAFRWLECLGPPTIAAPPRRLGRATTYYVRNNDLDAKGGDTRRVAEIRTAKRLHPTLLEGNAPLLYVWPFDGEDGHAARIAVLAERLHTLGHGIDAACARGAVTDWTAAEERLAAHGGPVFRPAGPAGGDGDPLCPVPGSLDSLKTRHADHRSRFQVLERGRTRLLLFRRPPKADCAPVSYACPPQRLLFDLRRPDDGRPAFLAWPLARASELVVAARDRAVARLDHALPETARALVHRLLVGRNASEADKAQRVRILPIPSIGHDHTDRSIRRLLVEIPPDCPLNLDDLAWAFCGIDLGVDADGVVTEGAPLLVPADDRSMLHHYGVDGSGARLWRTVTPAALPVPRPRGRTTGSQRAADEAEAVMAVRHALRHAGVRAAVRSVRVQREPWSGRGLRAEAFADSTRFPVARLWHVEVLFDAPVAGPLVIGDGRYLGLGLLAPDPAQPLPDRVDYAIAPATRPDAAQSGVVVAALRRALMSLAGGGTGVVPTLFSGHERDSGPARSGSHRHLYLSAEDTDGDGRLDRLTALAPWLVDRSWSPTTAEREAFDRATRALATLRAGAAGVLDLTAVPPMDETAPAHVWRSRTPYRPTRHPKPRQDAAAAIAEDLRLECARRGLPLPVAEVLRFVAGAGGLAVEARLVFAVAVRGPILLGRDAHAGGGRFVPEE